MNISILETNPLALYKDNFFEDDKEKNIATGIAHLIHFLYSGLHFTSPIYREIEPVDFSKILKLVFEAIDYTRNNRHRVQELNDAIHYFGLDGHERIPSYVDIAMMRNIRKEGVVRAHVFNSCRWIGAYLKEHEIDKLLLKQERSTEIVFSKVDEELLSTIDNALKIIEEQLEIIKKAREKLS